MTNAIQTMHSSLVTTKRFEITYWNGYMMRVCAPSAAVAKQIVLSTPGYTFYTVESLIATEIEWPRTSDGAELYGVC